MAFSSITGPLFVTGNTNPQQTTEWSEGPSCFADGVGVVDSRYAMTLGAASQYGYALNLTNAVSVLDAFPQTSATNNVVAAQGAGQAAGYSLPLASGTVQSAVANVPVVPWTLGTDIYGNRYWSPPSYTTGNAVTAGLALDFGFCAGTTFTSGTVTLASTVGPGNGVFPAVYAGQTVNKNQIIQLQTTNHTQPELMFSPGDNIIVANAGNAGGTVPLLATVVAVDYINHYVYMSVPALAAVTNAGIGAGNAVGSNPGMAYWPYNPDGQTILADERQMLSRTLQYVSTSASDNTATVTVSGYDVYGVPMTETITLNGTTIVNGKKAFKFIKSAVTGVATLVGNVNIGTTNTIGLGLRADSFSYLRVYVADAGITANTGFTKADITAPATAATGDPRGTYTMQSAPNGSTRIAVWQDLSTNQYQVGSNVVLVPVFGVAQF